MGERTRVLILGGGPSALTCAYHLTRTPELRARYDVTVLQLGWRLGGKGACGRNREVYDRIEEHGLHIMFGFYQNFFSMIEEVYDSLGRWKEGKDVPLATWREAFHPFDTGVVMDFYKGVWEPIALTFPRNDAVVGEGLALNDSRVYLGAILGAAVEVVFGQKALHDLNTLVFGGDYRWEHGQGDPSRGRADALVRFAMWCLREVLVVARDVSLALEQKLPKLLELLSALQRAADKCAAALTDGTRALHLLFQGVDFLCALVRGIAADGVLLEGGYARVDKFDFGEWLVSHGMLQETVNSVAVRFLYDAAFSYAEGSALKKRVAAGVAVRTLLRMGLTYKGAVYYKMMSGMGDTIMGPLYQALSARGVRFAFFNKVKSLQLAADKKSVRSVLCEVQATPKSGDPYDYYPLFDCKGLPSWPNEPFYDRLKDGDALRDIDLESYYTDYKGVGEREFLAGTDFDTCVFASPVATIPFIAKELYAHSPAWRDCADKVLSVQTVSMQAWFKPDLRGLGWTGPELPLLSLYVEPLNTWSDMSQTLPRENWPKELEPGNVAYFTGAQPGPKHPPLPEEDPDFPRRMTAAAKETGFQFLRVSATTLFPAAVDMRRPPELDWNKLVDAQDRVGRERYLGQYWRSNCEPHERCTVALPDTNQYRLKAHDTGFANVTVAGDWMDNGFYIACLEGAVMGGIYAARAVTGLPIPIIGEFIDEGLQPERPLPPRVSDPLPKPPPPTAPEAPAGAHDPVSSPSFLSKFPKDKKIKVAVLGGGLGAMTTVWGLLQSPVAERFEITVYQYGWRLGGKGASGRNKDEHQRIEEHGLHIWGGMYENAFEMIQGAYRLAKRKEGKPLSVWYDRKNQWASAFWPHNLVSLGEWDAGKWDFWNITIPANGSLPGDGKLLPSLLSYVEMFFEIAAEALLGARLMNKLEQLEERSGLFTCVERCVESVLGGVVQKLAREELGPEDRFRDRFHREGGGAAFSKGHHHSKKLHASQGTLLAAHRGPLMTDLLDALRGLRSLFARCAEDFLEHHASIRHAWELLDLGASMMIGCLEDGVLWNGFDVVDSQEFSTWLAKHGATKTTVDGALVRGWHGFFFANVNGDPSRPSLSAASALRTIFRYVFTYKGAFFWKMQAGMGDTIFAPIYQVARDLGVKFEFFHRVLEVRAGEGADADKITSIRVAKQVDLAPGRDAYDPLVEVKEVPSWPSEPLYDQLDPAQAAALQAQHINLESAWTPWVPVATKELLLGVDFDAVVLGLSVGPLATVCSTLLDRSETLANAAKLATNQTIAAQLWLDRPLRALGWKEGSTVGTVFAEPHNTWANMDQLLDKEDWSDAPTQPRALVYFCGTYTDATPIPPTTDHSFPEQNDVRVEAMTLAWLNSNMGALYPCAVTLGNPTFNPERLVAPRAIVGQDRLKAQFWRGNIDPSERYVLSLPGSAAQRSRADKLGFANMVGSGDWLYTGINAGCVEATVMGGLQASRALSGYPERIIGDDEFGF